MLNDKLERIEELEKELSYLVNDSMTLEKKLKSLADAYWEASHSGYGDAMANKLMGGEEDDQPAFGRKTVRINTKSKHSLTCSVS